MHVIDRTRRPSIAFESTILAHGLPEPHAQALYRDAISIGERCGVQIAVVGLPAGRPTVGMTDGEVLRLLEAERVDKVNTSNLGLAMHAGRDAATTVSATIELAAAAGLPLFATGGIGGVHRGYGARLDVSSDLLALSRFPVAVVASGCKNLLDVSATREALETLGVPVVGFRTDRFPAFYTRESDPPVGVDGTFDEAEDLAAFLTAELERTGRGVLVANPIPEADAVSPDEWAAWLAEAETSAAAAIGRDVTPDTLARLHTVSGGRTLSANIALARSNTDLACRLAAIMGHDGPPDPSGRTPGA
ncbi:MAG: pseudouridine-5'-phosphate glycosidase [Planctomycetota bacterium]